MSDSTPPSGEFGGLFRYLADAVREGFRTVASRRTVTGVETTVITVTSLDPDDPGEQRLAKLRDAYVEADDDVLVLRVDGIPYVIGALGVAGRGERRRLNLEVRAGNQAASGIGEIELVGSSWRIVQTDTGLVEVYDRHAMPSPPTFQTGRRGMFTGNNVNGATLATPVITFANLDETRAYRYIVEGEVVVTAAAGLTGGMTVRIPGTAWSESASNPGETGEYIDSDTGASGQRIAFGHARDIAPGVTSQTVRVMFRTSSSTSVQFDQMVIRAWCQALG